MSEGIDPMDPERVEARWFTDADASDDYRDLWSRCQKAEAERDGWREEFQKQVETTEARLEAAEELADAAEKTMQYGPNGCPCGTCEPVSAALARFRKDQACPACSGTGQKPDDSKIESKYQGASPSVPPAVTTDGVPVVREGREEIVIDADEFFAAMKDPVVQEFARAADRRLKALREAGLFDAPSVVSGGGQNEARIGEMTGELNRLITAEVESRLRTYVLPPDEVTVGREARIELLKYIDRIEEFIGLVPGWVIDLWNSTDPDLPQSLRDQWRESGLAALDKKGQDDG